MVKLEPIDLIQKTNIRQHDLMINAINANSQEIDEVRAVEDIAVSDISTIKNNIVVLSNEKLDKEDIDKDLHIGNISVTLEGTQAVATLDVYNPVTGITTPISFILPGATQSVAGVMTSSDVSWMQTAEERLAMLEGMSDVNAVTNLPSDPTQEQLSYGWTSGTGKSPETGDILQDVSNAKLWVFVTDTWILYGNLVIVPMASTSAIGGVRDTSLTEPGNRWYVHVENDGRISLIGGDALSTLIDTTIPAMQTQINGKVSKSGDTMTGILHIDTDTRYPLSITTDDAYPFRIVNRASGKLAFRMYHGSDGTNPILQMGGYNPDNRWNLMDSGIVYSGTHYINIDPPADDNTGALTSCRWVRARLTSKQNVLTFDSAPVAGSVNPVTSGGVKTALDTKTDLSKFSWTYGSGLLDTESGEDTCGYNYAYCVINNVVFMRFTVGASVDSVFTVPLPVSVGSASIQMSGVNDDARFWSDYNGVSASSVVVHRAQSSVSSKAFHVLVIGHKSS